MRRKAPYKCQRPDDTRPHGGQCGGRFQAASDDAPYRQADKGNTGFFCKFFFRTVKAADKQQFDVRLFSAECFGHCQCGKNMAACAACGENDTKRQGVIPRQFLNS